MKNSFFSFVSIAVFVGLVAFSLIIAGCSGRECEKKLDCEQKSCFDVSCIDSKCNYAAQQNCCGNKVCEGSEDPCTCQLDCGKCAPAKNETYRYLSYGCGSDNKCALDVSGEPTLASLSLSKSTIDFKTDIKLSFDQPFDMKSSDFMLDLEMTDLPQTVKDFKITKVQVIGTGGFGLAGKEFIIGEKDLNRPMWGAGSALHEGIIGTYEFPELENDQAIAVKVFYEYKKSSFGTEKIIRNSFTEKSSTKHVFVQPTRDYSCDDVDCDDGNPGTFDDCISGTHICTHNPIPNRCGDFVCGSDENKCTCQEDCGPCAGEISDNMENICYQNQCVSRLLSQSPGTLSAELSFSKFKVNLESNFNEPFDVNKDTFDIKLELASVDPSLETEVTITKIELVDGELQLGKLDLFSDNTLGAIRDSKTFNIPVSFPINDDGEVKKQVKVRVHTAYRYTKFGGQSETMFDDIKEYQFRSKVTFTNPDI